MTKKLTRSDVEELAAYASQRTYAGYCPPTLPIPPGTLAELCRTWLAVDSAPTETLHHLGGGHLAAELVLPEVWSELDGQRVKLVLAPEAGGGEG